MKNSENSFFDFTIRLKFLIRFTIIMSGVQLIIISIGPPADLFLMARDNSTQDMVLNLFRFLTLTGVLTGVFLICHGAGIITPTFRRKNLLWKYRAKSDDNSINSLPLALRPLGNLLGSFAFLPGTFFASIGFIMLYEKHTGSIGFHNLIIENIIFIYLLITGLLMTLLGWKLLKLKYADRLLTPDPRRDRGGDI